METKQNDSLLNIADNLLQSSQDSFMNRDDGISRYKVCQNSRQAVINSMTHFLFQKGMEPKGPITMQNLLDQCKAADDRFNQVDLNHILCKHEEGNDEYCISEEKVGNCLRSAQMVYNIASGPISKENLVSLHDLKSQR